ncbi:MAG TPA: hypothetical protein VJL87_05805 [Bdellovibrionota bacterium]|nr:hypothetical protein [Bdellovibrionota bacterium]
MKNFSVFLLTILFSSLAFGDDPSKEVAGAFGDHDLDSLKKLSCPSTIALSVPNQNRNIAVIRGKDGKVSDVSVVLSLKKVGEKTATDGKCFYDVAVNKQDIVHIAGRITSTEVLDKEARPLLPAIAYRRADRDGEQVVGLNIPLASSYRLKFLEIPLENIFDKEGLETERLVATARVEKVVEIKGANGEPDRQDIQNFGEVTLIVSLTK